MAKDNLLGYFIKYADESSQIERDRIYQRMRDTYFRGIKRISFKCTVEHTIIIDGHPKNIKGVVMGEFITNVTILDVAQQVEAYILTQWAVFKFGNDLSYEIKQL